VSCAKIAEPIEMPFELRTRVGPRNHVLGGVYTGASWRIPLNRPCAAAMRPFCQITLTTCYYFISARTNTAEHTQFMRQILLRLSTLSIVEMWERERFFITRQTVYYGRPM